MRKVIVIPTSYYRMLRGSCWRGPVVDPHAAYRYSFTPEFRLSGHGLRVRCFLVATLRNGAAVPAQQLKSPPR